MTELFSDVHRMTLWLEVETVVVEAYGAHGLLPLVDATEVRRRQPVVDEGFVTEVLLREEITDHDLAAFVDVAQARVGLPEGAWIHFGLTSSDVVDTALSMMIRDAIRVVIDEVQELRVTLVKLARRHATTVMVGRTHGIHAEPTTFGVKLALWSLQVGRDLRRLERARDVISVGKLSGAVGTYSNIDPEVERLALDRLGLDPAPSTQVIARDRHGEVLYALTSLACSLEAFATEIRHLQRTEVREVQEPFKEGQKGSSAMPHKRNPILSERLSGMARLMRGYLHSALEDVALWHERDISHSSVERVIVPDAFQLAHYMVRRFRRLMVGLRVDEERMAQNLLSSFGLVYSQPVLLRLIESGLSRDVAYRIVQRCAMRSWEEQVHFADVLRADPEVTLTDAEITDAMRPERALAHIEHILTAAEAECNSSSTSEVSE
jgi:adenylosuccinate lyase